MHRTLDQSRMLSIHLNPHTIARLTETILRLLKGFGFAASKDPSSSTVLQCGCLCRAHIVMHTSSVVAYVKTQQGTRK
jgi:hypothetical protein